MHKAYADHGRLPDNLLDFIKSGEEVLIFDDNTLIACLLPIKTANPEPLPACDDLDDLAGVWSAEDEQQFLAATADFGQIDEALWR
ncbi:MAG: hypothetical protein GY862_28810 [Gammaproteobacteria bacterium]|nr:hypothetical protein [Gammaproteobacteria bacterium]